MASMIVVIEKVLETEVLLMEGGGRVMGKGYLQGAGDGGGKGVEHYG